MVVTAAQSPPRTLSRPRTFTREDVPNGRDSRSTGLHRAGWGLIAAGTALVPWMWMLAVRLPSTTQVSHWSAAWVGLDAMLAAGLVGTGEPTPGRHPPTHRICGR